MKSTELKRNIRILATLRETDFPVVSCYVDMAHGLDASRAFLADRVPALRRTIPKEQRRSFDRSLQHIERFINDNASDPAIRGIVAFARSVEDPFLYGMRFPVPLSEQLTVDRVPHISQLVTLRNTYDRYVVVLMNKQRACILEVNLGAITRQTWSQHPPPPDRIERQWSKERYQRHRHRQTQETIREKIKALNGLMAGGAHSHLILAGEPAMVERMKAALPSHLHQKLVDTVHTNDGDHARNVVSATLASFVAFREQHFETYVTALQHAIYADGLGVLGTDATLHCLRHARADVLVLAEEYDPGPAWQCRNCADILIARDGAQACPECSGTRFRRLDIKEEMVRLAEGSSCTVSVVRDNEFLKAGGGVGCLTRY